MEVRGYWIFGFSKKILKLGEKSICFLLYREKAVPLRHKTTAI